MKRSIALVLAALLPACAETTPPPSTPSTLPPSAAGDGWTFAEEAPTPRLRLTETITLGEGYGMPAAAAAPGAAGGPTVVIQNNVVVNNTTPHYGGYGVYSYSTGGSGSGSTHHAGGETGWEGASGRPVDPGHTPNVGGNWPIVHSYGPK